MTTKQKMKIARIITKAARAKEKSWDYTRDAEVLLNVEDEDEGLDQMIEGLAVSGGDCSVENVEFLLGENLVSCPKCGSQVHKSEAFEDEGEGPEAGRTFYYCSEHCRETH